MFTFVGTYVNILSLVLKIRDNNKIEGTVSVKWNLIYNLTSASL